MLDEHGYAQAPTTIESSGQTPYGFGLTAKGPLIVSEAFGGAAGAAAAFLVCGVWRWRAHGERRADGVYLRYGPFSQGFRSQYRAAVAAVSGSRESGLCCRTWCRSS